MADPVQLTDLDVISRYSIAVRSASADRDDLIETLRADLAWLEGLRRPAREPSAPPRAAEAVPREAPAPRQAAAPSRQVVRRASATKKTAAKKTTTRRTTR